MQRKKFILFDETPGSDQIWDYSKYEAGGYQIAAVYDSFSTIGNDASGATGEASAQAVDFSMVTQGMGFVSEGGAIGENLVSGGNFEPSDESEWTLSVGSNAAAAASFTPDDFNHRFENGQLKMRTYQGAGNIPPYIAQDIVLGENLGIFVKMKWRTFQNHDASQVYVRNYLQGGYYKNRSEFPGVRITYNGNSTLINAIGSKMPHRSDTQDEINLMRVGAVTAAQIAALGASPGDTVSLELHARSYNNTGPLSFSPSDHEHIIDSFEVYESAGPSLAFYSINPYECTDYFNFFEAVSVEEGLEDMIKVLEASSSLGENGNKESAFVEVKDLGLNSRKAYGTTAWVN